MPIREPGVIVYISGQDLPPPLPPTQLGLGAYVDAGYGPYKLRFTTIRDYNNIYKNPNNALNSELAFLLPNSSLYCMMLPGLHLKPAAGIIVFHDTTNLTGGKLDLFNDLFTNFNNNTQVSNSRLFAFPSWLNGIPKYIGHYRLSTSSVNGNANINRVRLTYNGNTFVFFEDYSFNLSAQDYADFYTNRNGASFPFNDLSDVFSSIRFVVHKENKDLLIWFYQENEGNYVINAVWDNNANSYDVFIWGDDDNIFSASSINLDIEYSDNTTQQLDLTPASNMSGRYFERGQDYTILYVTPDVDSTDVNLLYFTSQNGDGFKLKVDYTFNNNPVSMEYEYFTYEPTETGYYGFIKNSAIEMFVSGDLYSASLNNNAYIVRFNTGSSVKITTSFNFVDPRHIGVIPKSWINAVNSTYTPKMAGVFTQRIGNNNNNYKYVYNWLYDVETRIIRPYNGLMSYHNSLIYYEDDIIPLWETPSTVDIVHDYSGKLGYSFTHFIRTKHTKLMFKVCGLPDASYVPLSRRFNDFAKPYWEEVIGEMGGFHYYRINGSSLRGVSGTTLYLKAVIDYKYKPIFGINAPIPLVDSDHEFTLSQREILLDYNANSIVKDRVLSLFYINNNLTEEATRDDSPLGEENNARYAIRLSKSLALYVERYIGEPNNQVTRNKITSDLNNFINNFKETNPGRMVDHRVICDETNNTPADIANNRLNIRVEVRFAKSVKYVVVFERVLLAT